MMTRMCWLAAVELSRLGDARGKAILQTALGESDPAAWQEVYRTLMQVARLERQEYFTAVALLLRETHWEKGPWPSPALSQEKITAVIDGLLTMIEDQQNCARTSPGSTERAGRKLGTALADTT